MSNHTPGPWDCAPGQRVDGFDYFMVYDAHEARVPCTDANARLIAAAPELLAALRDAENDLMLVAMGNTELDRLEESALACAARIRAAIAKAEGR